MGELAYLAESVEFRESGGVMDQYTTAFGGLIYIKPEPSVSLQKIDTKLGNFVLGDSIGSVASQDADNVTITGGSITDITDIAVADGGTGASDVTTARQNLGLDKGVDIQANDADLADLADGTLSASKVENGEFFIPSAGTNGQVWTSDGDGVGVWGAPAGLTGAGSTIDSEDLAVSRAVVSSASGKIEVSDVTSTELSYLDGVTSAVQTQLDAKQAVDDD